MGELKETLTAIKEYIKIARIYYKVSGSDKIHIITPLTYGFLKGKVFDLEKLAYNKYKVNDNISYIHFYKSADIDGSAECIEACPNTEVKITVDSGKYNFKVKASDVCIKDDDKFSVQVRESKEITYSTDESLVVYYASKTSIDGNIDVQRIEILYSPLEINNMNKNIDYLFHIGNKISFDNVHCKIKDFSTDARSIDIKNSSIESYSEVFTDEYNRQIVALEDEKDIIINNSQTNIVKTFVKKKEN